MAFQDTLTRVRQADGRQLIGASFRGVPFFVESAERGGGRRALSHEYPLRNENTVEDLGRRRRTFSMTGYVIGDDYAAQRDALLDALENTDGPGELIHPYYGVRQALCTDVTVAESISQGGRATFSLQFLEVQNPPVTPETTADRVAQVDAAADSSQVQIETEFVESYDTSRSPSYAVASLTAELVDRTQGLRDTLGLVVEDTQELARLDLEVQTLVSEATTLIRSPRATIDAYVAVLATVTETALSAPGDVLGALIETYNLPDQPLAPGITDIRQRERDNQIALTGVLKRTLAIAAARLSPRVPYETLDGALAARDGVLAALGDELDTANETTFNELQDLRSAVALAVPGDQELARLISLTQRTAVPGLLLSYRLYGTTDRLGEILERNTIPDPSFVFGQIQVLSE